MALGDTLKNYTIGVGIRDNNFTAGLKNMGGQLRTFVSQMGIMLGAGSLGMAFKKFIDTGTDISNFSSLTGIAEQDITALGGALEQFGGNVDSAKSSLQALQQGLSLAEWGQGQLLETAALYGVELYNQDGSLKNAQQLLMGLADDFQHLTKAQQFTLGSQLGLDESTILLLQQGKTSIKALLAEQQKMGAMNANQAADAKKFSIEWTKLKQSLGGLGRSIAVDIMPPVIDFVKQLGKAVDWVRNLDTYTIMLAGSFGVLGYAIKNLQGIMTIFSKSFLKANLPLLALITGLTILFLVVEDIVGYFNGKESLFGKFLENDKVQAFIQKIQNAFAWIKDLINNFSFDKLFDGLLSFAKGLKDAFGDTFAWIFETLSAIGSNIGAMILNPFIDGINNILDMIPEKVAKGLGFKNGLQIPRYEMKELPNYFEFSDKRNIERMQAQNNNNNNYNNMPVTNNYNNLPVVNNYHNQNTQNAGVNNNTQNNTVNVTVQGTGDSLQDITKAVEKGFNSNYISPALILNTAK